MASHPNKELDLVEPLTGAAASPTLKPLSIGVVQLSRKDQDLEDDLHTLAGRTPKAGKTKKEDAKTESFWSLRTVSMCCTVLVTIVVISIAYGYHWWNIGARGTEFQVSGTSTSIEIGPEKTEVTLPEWVEHDVGDLDGLITARELFYNDTDIGTRLLQNVNNRGMGVYYATSVAIVLASIRLATDLLSVCVGNLKQEVNKIPAIVVCRRFSIRGAWVALVNSANSFIPAYISMYIAVGTVDRALMRQRLGLSSDGDIIAEANLSVIVVSFLLTLSTACLMAFHQTKILRQSMDHLDKKKREASGLESSEQDWPRNEGAPETKDDDAPGSHPSHSDGGTEYRRLFGGSVPRSPAEQEFASRLRPEALHRLAIVRLAVTAGAALFIFFVTTFEVDTWSISFTVDNIPISIVGSLDGVDVIKYYGAGMGSGTPVPTAIPRATACSSSHVFHVPGYTNLNFTSSVVFYDGSSTLKHSCNVFRLAFTLRYMLIILATIIALMVSATLLLLHPNIHICCPCSHSAYDPARFCASFIFGNKKTTKPQKCREHCANNCQTYVCRGRNPRVSFVAIRILIFLVSILSSLSVSLAAIVSTTSNMFIAAMDLDGVDKKIPGHTISNVSANAADPTINMSLVILYGLLEIAFDSAESFILSSI